ncbi:family 43 glycosylhydrolase [Neobacillus terrae]|uniref:family 43 glycosylhydrolase n=1 Tax=Neobacillus terrae TaxID=3034837 RepID=UPI0014096F7F|nr:family 43 glycosylhydrolase [Neobacillus terrae]
MRDPSVKSRPRETSQAHSVEEAPGPDPFSGTWRFKGKISDSTDRWAIDGTVLELEGTKYFIWSGWEGNTNVKQNLYIARMSNPFDNQFRKENDIHSCI